jgi:hypothetical protein
MLTSMPIPWRTHSQLRGDPVASSDGGVDSEVTNAPYQRNGFGIAALVLGLCGLPAGFAGVPGGIGASILAIILGVIGVNRARSGRASHIAIARWGMWLGIAGTAVTAFWLVYLTFIAHNY